MIQRVIYRIVGGLGLLFLISVVTFYLFKALPGDAYSDQVYQAYTIGDTRENAELRWREYITENALDKPLFYFAIKPSYIDKRAAEIPLNSDYKLYIHAAENYQPNGKFYNMWSWFTSAEIDRAVLNKVIGELHAGVAPALILEELKDYLSPEKYAELESLSQEVILRDHKMSFPSFSWNGSNNQYHYWIGKVLSGDLVSEKLNQSVFSAIWAALIWTLSINIPAFILLFLGGVILGTFRSLRNGRIIRVLEKIMYGFYSMPLFWLCTLALTVAINWFPQGSFKILVGGFQEESYSLLTIYKNHFSSLYLAIICIVLHNTIYISRHTEQSIDSVKESRYVLAARSRGISSRLLLKKHIIPNSLRPIITLIPQLLPGLIAGSIVIELIFNIPGMGRLFWDSLMGRDWQMILGMVLFISVIVYLSMWLADVLYPRKDKIDTYE